MYKQDTKNPSVDNVCLFFENNYIFVDNFNTSSQSYQSITGNCTDKRFFARSEGLRVDIWGLGMRTEKNKYSLLSSMFWDSSLSRN